MHSVQLTIDLQAAAEDAYSVMEELETRKGVLKVKEVAELFRISVDAVYDGAAKGRIPSFSIGNQIRFDPRTLALWLRKKAS